MLQNIGKRFGKIVLIHFGGLNIGEYHMDTCIYLCKSVVGGLNIGGLIQKSPIAIVSSYTVLYTLAMHTCV